MRWLKKVSDLFVQGEEENRYIDEYPAKEEQSHTDRNIHNRNEENRSHQSPILSSEQDKKIAREVFFDQMNNNQFEKTKVDTGVYDIEQSGIRDLLANRGTKVKKERIFRSQRTDVKEVPPIKGWKKEVSPFDSLQDDIPVQSRKRFTPTDVPSPVYGFAKPSSINSLLEKKRVEVDDGNFLRGNREQIIVKKHEQEAAATNLMDEVNVESIISQEIDLFSMDAHESLTMTSDPNDLHPESENLSVSKRYISQSPIIEESIETSSEGDSSNVENAVIPMQDVVVQHVKIENSTFNIGELTVEHIVRLEESTSKEQEELPSLSEESVELSPKKVEEVPFINEAPKTGSRLPFNVIMLQSDKAKLAAKKLFEVPSIKPEMPDIMSHHIESVVTVEEETSPLLSIRMEPVVQNDKQEKETITIMPVKELMIDSEIEHREELSSEVDNYVSTNIIEQPVMVNPVSFNEQPIISDINNSGVDDSVLVETNHIPEVEASSLESVSILPSNQEQLKPVIENPQEEQQLISVENEKPVQLTKPSKIYIKPSFDLLEPPEEKAQDTEWMELQADKLVETLSYFQVAAHVESIKQGPAVTQFEITVGQGIKVSKIRNLADDLKLALAAKDIRIQAPIPGKSSIGIEIPNRKSRAVRLSEVTNSGSFLESDSPLEAALGLDLTGKPVTIDLRKMPHGLIAGATGSGKSVCINTLLVSLLYKSTPQELKLMLIDPKMVELAPFNHIPHLVSPVITDVKAATAALKWAVEEMERRYQLFAATGVRDLSRYNNLAHSNGQHGLKLPYILIVIDELADLMMMSPADVEEAICRIAQKARACGIHLILATQRPSVDVITGLIKSNIPTRIAFAVSSAVDSRTIIDTQGAERLLGRGDMLYLGNGMSDPIRIQGTFVTDDEIEAIVDHVREQGEPDYFFDQEELLRKNEISEEQDDLFEEVCRFVYDQGSASTSLIQRKYHIGYNRAARLIDMLEKNGYVSEQRGSKARDVYITETELSALFD